MGHIHRVKAFKWRSVLAAKSIMVSTLWITGVSFVGHKINYGPIGRTASCWPARHKFLFFCYFFVLFPFFGGEWIQWAIL